MLQIKSISKRYMTGDFVQDALKDVHLNFRDQEFVAILGASGSGKTTLLNIIGGLDRYDNGDLVIDGKSTKEYKDRDWDSYRNHRIGFVFQSYNLIPHQSVLANVELALTISGIKKSERRKRAAMALEQVGLNDQLHKKPNQMSGGQMQRVAIARALVNNPEILLADEPTGALDSETSLQVMELLKKVAKDRLVIMVTHNKEMAEEYANRIIQLRDGQILEDSNPYNFEENIPTIDKNRENEKASMSFATSLALSFNNLRTKKSRTLLTAFAGSIGIIGIALILSLSTGVNDYINDIQKETMDSYPITIEAESVDLSSMQSIMNSFGTQGGSVQTKGVEHDSDRIYSDSSSFDLASKISFSIMENNLTAFKQYLDNPASKIHEYVGENGIVYSYDLLFDAYAYDPDGILVNTDGSSLTSQASKLDEMSSKMTDSMFGSDSYPPIDSSSFMMGGDPFQSSGSPLVELLPGNQDSLISTVTLDNYELIYGHLPTDYDELIIITDVNHEIPLYTLYELGMLPSSEYQVLLNSYESNKDYVADVYDLSYEEVCEQTLYLIPECDYYIENDLGNFYDLREDIVGVEGIIDQAIPLTIVGIICPKEDASNANISGTVGYTKALTDWMIEYTDKSAVVQAQKENPEINILNGMEFQPSSEEVILSDTVKYIEALGISEKAGIMKSIATTLASESGPTSFLYQAQLDRILSMDETSLVAMVDQYMEDPDEEVLLSIYHNYISVGSYEENMASFGYVNKEAPSSISIYSDRYKDKDGITTCIESYNNSVSEENRITYIDFVALITTSVTKIIRVISYVLIAFVAVSLVVSSIMIGIITYISVLERTKEIGILRALGASKRNISGVFNAETFIVGLCSGILGVALALLLLIPINAVIYELIDSSKVNASLSVPAALILIVLSVLLTFIGGFIPAKKAARKDPVVALRAE